MQIKFALLFSLIAAVVATVRPAPSPDVTALDTRVAAGLPLCTWIVNCGGFGSCKAGPCIDAGYSCDGPGVPTLAPSGTPNATCTTACSCESFCAGPIGPECPP
ncbi:hypothetical protein B0H13DRAFT_1968457 [Mycena leptocephala]|nr:hypothetical protein B0H13DRAFT_1968457 [Mycena leptocephala]